jgi:hypothetical protein
MRGRIRLSAVATLVLLVPLAIAALTSTSTSSAGAVDAPGTYNVSATGSVLTINALGALTISGAASSAAAGSGKAPTATGSGTTSPLGNSTATATEETAGRTDAPAQVCGPLPSAPVVVATVGSACGQATASLDPAGNPAASGAGSLPQTTLGSGLSALTTPISSTVTSTVTGLLGPLQALLNATDTTTGAALPTPAGVPLNALIADLENISPSSVANLVTAKLGTSTSTIATSSNSAGDTIETATTTTTGTSIDLLPGLLDGSPLATITLGHNSATTALDRATGAVTASDEPAAVSVTVAGVPVSIGQGTGETPILAGTPLASTIQIGGGAATPGQGTGSAQAGSVELNLLTGISGGVNLDLATSRTSADDAPAATTIAAPVTQAAAPPVPNVTTVHTGEFWSGPLPIVLLAGMGLAGLVLVARRRIASAARTLFPTTRHSTMWSTGGPPPGPASGTSSVPPPVSGPARRQSP